MSALFTSYQLGPTRLANRIVMAPMTRSRAIGNVPNELMRQYYTQRVTAGLIITEGIAPSPDGLGYARIPGLFSDAQVEQWARITEGVHTGGGAIFAQLMHTGRIGHPLNMPAGAQLVAPSAVRAAGKMYTDQQGMLDHPEPRAMDADDLRSAIDAHARAARNARRAGFDGVEMHAANGYLLEQFLNPYVNRREDEYGGTVERRARFVVEATAAAAEQIGADRVGVRISPYSTLGDMAPYEETDAQYLHLARARSACACHRAPFGARVRGHDDPQWRLRWRRCRCDHRCGRRIARLVRPAVHRESGLRGAAASTRGTRKRGSFDALHARCAGLCRLSGPAGTSARRSIDLERARR
jgi:N-ethylmaleimide reductase